MNRRASLRPARHKSVAKYGASTKPTSSIEYFPRIAIAAAAPTQAGPRRPPPIAPAVVSIQRDEKQQVPKSCGHVSLYHAAMREEGRLKREQSRGDYRGATAKQLARKPENQNAETDGQPDHCCPRPEAQTIEAIEIVFPKAVVVRPLRVRRARRRRHLIGSYFFRLHKQQRHAGDQF